MVKHTTMRVAYFLLLLNVQYLIGQNIYFPPNNEDTWATTSLQEIGWCQQKVDTLLDYLENQNTEAFIILKDGKIVIEEYFGTFGKDSLWYWASAGKTLTACLTGIAQKKGLLSIQYSTSQYLGQGWTSLTPQQEQKITIWNQLTMTTGLDDGVADPFCTDSNCLTYKSDPGTRWAYHNAPYTLISRVLEVASGQDYNVFTALELKNKIGMDGFWFPSGFNKVYFSKPRSMARFGLLIQAGGVWDGTLIMQDTGYFRDMITPSQTINPAYGYLWWLNGQSTFMVPQTQFVFAGQMSPHAPSDMFAAMGKNGQLINVVPSEGLVVVRMGNSPDNSLVPVLFQDEMWAFISDLACTATSVETTHPVALTLSPNPASDKILIEHHGSQIQRGEIRSLTGQIIKEWTNLEEVSLEGLSPGLYFIRVQIEDVWRGQKFYKN